MDNYLEQIKDTISIVAEISKITTLHKKGREYTGCCPFHKEKTPSFYVNPIKGFYYCFGCGAKGNIFNFYTDYYRMSFPEAVKSLADQAGIKIPKSFKIETIDYKKKYYELTNAFADYSSKQLLHSIDAINYLKNRGIKEKTLKEFYLGYIPHKYEDFFNNYSDYYTEILDIGLKAMSERQQEYTFLRNRIIFPILDIKGNIIAFGGRTLTDENPKYLNTKESKIFSKKSVLYGLYNSLKNLRNNNLIIVEGYMDVISLHQHGINTAVASLGTSLTKEHINIIKKYDKSPVFCMDGDEAGKKAAYRVLNICLEELEIGFLPRFIFLQNKEDPDSYIQNNSKESFMELCQNAKSLSEVLWLKETEGNNLKLPEVALACLSALENSVKLIKNNEIRKQFMFFFKREIFVSNYAKSNNFSKNKADNLNYYSTVDSDYGIKLSACIMLYCISEFSDISDIIEEDFFTCDYKDKNLERLRVLFIQNYDKIKKGVKFEQIANEFMPSEYKYMEQLLKNDPLKKEVVDTASALSVFQSAYKRQKREQLVSMLEGVGEYLLIAMKDNTTNKAQVFHAQLKEINLQIKQLSKIS